MFECATSEVTCKVIGQKSVEVMVVTTLQRRTERRTGT